jgi:hypothetical protein
MIQEWEGCHNICGNIQTEEFSGVYCLGCRRRRGEDIEKHNFLKKSNGSQRTKPTLFSQHELGRTS